MDTLQLAYKILYRLEHKSREEFMGWILSPERLGASGDKWLEVVQSLQDEGYIAGVVIRPNVLGETEVDICKVKITVKGAQYLHENSAMRRFAKVATDVITIAKP